MLPLRVQLCMGWMGGGGATGFLFSSWLVHMICTPGLILPELTAADDTQNIFIIFQPQLDNGLVFTLTDENATTALLAVGMFNGEVSSYNHNGHLCQKLA